MDRRFRPAFYVWAPQHRLADLKTSLLMLGTAEVSEERRRTWLGEREREVLRVVPSTYDQLHPLARTVDRWGLYRDHKLFNVDLRMDHRYFLAARHLPHGAAGVRRALPASGLPLPPRLSCRTCACAACDLKVEARRGIPTMEDRLIYRARSTIPSWKGTRRRSWRSCSRTLRDRTRTCMFTDGGDAFYLDYLEQRAERNGIALELGREAGHAPGQGEELLHLRPHRVQAAGAQAARPDPHRPGSRSPSGRAACTGSSTCRRLSLIPLQDLSRLSPGSAISAMQVNEAVRMGTLVLWKKNLPEDFKTAGALMVSDRGGFIYEPKVGVHEQRRRRWTSPPSTRASWCGTTSRRRR